MSRPTQRQTEAWGRNWRIFCLRGMYQQIINVVEDIEIRQMMLSLVDQELERLGAHPETDRRKAFQEFLLKPFTEEEYIAFRNRGDSEGEHITGMDER